MNMGWDRELLVLACLNYNGVFRGSTCELTTNVKTSTNVETWNILLTNVKNHRQM